MRAQQAAHRESREAPLSLFARLERAIAGHAALDNDDDDDDDDDSPCQTSDESDPSTSPAAEPKSPPLASPSRFLQPNQGLEDRDLPRLQTTRTNPRNSTNSVVALADQLQTLLQPKTHGHEMQDGEQVDGAEDHSVSRKTLLIQNALAKVGSAEKDDLLVHLLQQAASYRAQLNEVATLGETIAAQLVHQQHELRVKHREQLECLEHELHNAVHAHPRVTALEERVDELEEQIREKDQQLRFAVQKLQRSRQREKELKTMHDPLWVI